MISGTITMLMAWTLATTPVSAPAPAPEAAASNARARALIEGLRRAPPTHTPFAEAKFSPLLDRALVVSGTLGWMGGDHLRRQVEAPYAEDTVIAGGKVTMTRQGHGTRHFSLDRAPPLKALLGSLVAVLSGDATRLQRGFSTRLDGDDAHGWTLTLRPESPRMAKGLSHIRLDGHGHTLDCMEIAQEGGTVSIDLLGGLAARMPARPTRAQLTGLCRRAH